VLKVGFQILLGETGQEFRLGTFVDFTDAVYQLPFAHAHTSFKSGKIVCNLRNIDRTNVISLARRMPVQATPHNPGYHIAGKFLWRPPDIDHAANMFFCAIGLSNKIILGAV
jgi:hypothetical protein